MKKPTTAEAIRTAYELPEIQTAIALRARHQSNAHKLITDLQNTAAADKAARNAAAIVERATPYWKAYARATAAAEEAAEDAKINRAISRDANRRPEEQAIAQAAAQAAESRESRLRATARKHRERAEAIEAEALDRTLSDRADLVQEAAAAALIPHVITPEEYEAAAAQLDEGTSPEDIAAAAWGNFIFTGGIAAAGHEVDRNRHHSTHNSEVTTKRLATAEDLAAWRAVHGENSGKGYRVSVGRDGINYLTLEYRTYKREPSGWYIVHHQKTTAARISLEAFTEDSHGAEAELITNGGIPFVETQEAAERIQALIDRANLTARERDFLAYFLGARAAHHGAIAAQAYRAEHGKKATRSGASKAEYTGMLEAAYNHIGVYTTEARKKFIQRLRVRAAAAAKVEQGCPTPEEAAEADRRKWERLQSNRRRQSDPAITAAVDALAWTTTAAPVKTLQVVAWIESGNTPQAITPGEDYRAAEVLKRDSYRQTAPKAAPPELTARERRERERLAARDADTAALIAKCGV